ncbi:clathrin light chain 2 [Physcomitrium patens]|uniref:Clathrin light chain n=1 Tax=Physcomitrium patens TaxID=3218 RepID=A0A2K1JMM6_PHYPA|nr:clathrin light chain 2-like [Physcomitrium patens]PNR42783.1 hypothetical protein PHYPA_017613 [Physcomitrium patens]|eukprot:XP_024392773.1 clathrin light chain 2-like [Physcomitrella patens]
MHTLVSNRSEIKPQAMLEHELDHDSNNKDGDGAEALQYLFSIDPDAGDYCQPCSYPRHASPAAAPPHVPDSIPHNTLSSSCSYGIQALINNVHRGYINDDDDAPMMSPVPEDLSQQQESETLRQWKRKKELELQEKQRETQIKQDRILEHAAIERENFYKEREVQIEEKKRLNREKETKYRADAEMQQKLVEDNLWAAVAALIDLNGDQTDGMMTANGSGKQISKSQISTPKRVEQRRLKEYAVKPTKKTTDLSRMREILLKLQQRPLVRSSPHFAGKSPLEMERNMQ